MKVEIYEMLFSAHAEGLNASLILWLMSLDKGAYISPSDWDHRIPILMQTTVLNKLPTRWSGEMGCRGSGA